MADAAVAAGRSIKVLAWRSAAAALVFGLSSGAVAADEDPSAGAERAVASVRPPVQVQAIDDVGVRRDGPIPEQARPEQCVGTDLVQALRLSDPASFEKFENSARGVVNGQGLLWRIEGGGKVSYLFGTMHSSEAIAKTFDALVLRALARSRFVAIELPGASTRRVAAELRRLVSNRSFRPEGGALGALPADIRSAVETRIAQAGIPGNVADQLQPWYLALALSRSQCATMVQSSDPETADARLERLAVEQGSAIVALESPIDQVDALAAVPDEVALRMLRDATVHRMRPEDVETTITGLYSTRRIGYLLAMRGPLWAGVFDVDGYADFVSAFITRRNAAMLQRALPVLKGGDAFFAVGALHLPGDSGLVEMIRRSGYSVTRIW